MEKLFVPKMQSIQLRELGFDEPCLAFYNGKFLDLGVWDREYPVGEKRIDIGECPQAPTFSQAFTFFREKYKLYPEIGLHDREDEETWRFTISILGYYELAYNQDISKEPYYKTYEEAELACLDKLIEITKNKQ